VTQYKERGDSKTRLCVAILAHTVERTKERALPPSKLRHHPVLWKKVSNGNKNRKKEHEDDFQTGD